MRNGVELCRPGSRESSELLQELLQAQEMQAGGVTVAAAQPQSSQAVHTNSSAVSWEKIK